ncbi:MAG: NUDIX domain-containing protein [Bacteroidota bacterium]
MNPKPVVVVLLPIKGKGILLVRRATSDGYGKLALPGGYLDWGERWQEGAARELREETGIELAADDIRFFSLANTDDGSHILIFCTGPETSEEDVPEAAVDHEVSEYVISPKAIPLAFPTHTEALRQIFEDSSFFA